MQFVSTKNFIVLHLHEEILPQIGQNKIVAYTITFHLDFVLHFDNERVIKVNGAF